jgi:Tol biopolymer transport system component
MMKKLIWLVIGVLILSGSSCEKKLPVVDFPVIPYQKDHNPAVFTDSLGKKTIAYYYTGEPKPDDPYYKAGIYLCDFEQREPKLFLRSPAYGISFSPDGNWIALSDTRIWKIKLNGDSLTLLVDYWDYETEVFSPAWSPDGKKIAFAIAGGPNRGIYLMDPDGSNKEYLIPIGRCPAWSPDGNRLYYSNWTRKSDTDTTYAEEIFYYDFSTQKEKRLTYLYRNWFTSQPSVSPSGEKIVFTSEEPRKLPQVWIMGKNGENLKQITSQGGCDPVFISEDEILYVKVVWGDGRLWLIGIDGQNDKPFFKK